MNKQQFIPKQFCSLHERCSIFDAFSDVGTRLRNRPYFASGSIACMNDVAFSMRLVNTGIELRNCPYFASGSIACMNDVAFLMRLVNTGIELRNCPYLSLLQEISIVAVCFFQYFFNFFY
ncbi:MAG: hypothetical protein PUF08_06050 [Clostridiales bacterium]|nr:hypothetical protein [Clostridiales bacterium]